MSSRLHNLWDDARAEQLSEPELLQYRSNLLGSDLRITNFGGGNTSAKVMMSDPLNDPSEEKKCEVLWVKGSGGDLGSIKLDGFTTLYMDKLKQLKNLYRGLGNEDEMVDYLPHCNFNLNSRAASIDTPLHAYIPHAHVDHMHPDSVIAIACTKDSKALTEKIFDGELEWLAWQRPGYDLGLKLEALCQEQPDSKGIVLEGHGLFTWGNNAKNCYLNTLNIIQQAADWLAENNCKETFGGPALHEQKLGKEQQRDIAATLMPLIRGKITENSVDLGDIKNEQSTLEQSRAKQYKVGHFNQQSEVMEFVNSKQLKSLAELGTSCPDHFLRTKIRPLVLDFDPSATDLKAELGRTAGLLDQQLNTYREEYQAYYQRCKNESSPAMRDANAVVYLIPGVGMITFAKDKATARIAGEFFCNAINVMREADAVSEYIGLNEQEAFNIEYWLLEEAKLQRQPKPKSLAGRIAFITGGAGGIGKATAIRLLQEGACVILADIDEDALANTSRELSEYFGHDVVQTVQCDVRNESSVINSLHETALEFGGLDILVSNAGIASSAPLNETSLELWNKNIDILSTGYFLVSREAFKVMKVQNNGGAMVFVVSKNALVASPNASAYCTAKAAELHLARCIALEGAPLGIRCNVVNPDAVLRGSKIWTGKWREERAAAYNMGEDELEAHYRDRSLLKRNVFPEDIAEAIYFLTADTSAKSTGNVLNVDAGHAPSFTR